MKIAIIGGGAAGFFLGALLPSFFDVHIFEKSSEPLRKVKISGGGRCNLTHGCFDPNLLVDFYPRGRKELKSVFGRFQPGDTMAWFEEKGVSLKIEEDMRVFPSSNNSTDIVSCLINENQKNGTKIHLKEAIIKVEQEKNQYRIISKTGEYLFDKIVFASGSSQQVWDIIATLGHKIIKPVPSLFTFNCKDKRIQDLQGTVIPNAQIKILDSNLENSGDLLITHWGFSGPAVLVLSAHGARFLNERNYNFKVEINFIGENTESLYQHYLSLKTDKNNQIIGNLKPIEFTKRFWQKQLDVLGIDYKLKLGEIKDKVIYKLAKSLTSAIFHIDGRSVFKDEFVTAGGVDLKEINFKNMESKLLPGVHFAGEVVNIDAVTGGFNFQACWSESFIISEFFKSSSLI